MDIRERARELLLKNYSLTGKKYIAPDNYHRDQWLWDSCFHAISCAELDLRDIAKNEIERLLKWQNEDGWIPHQIYATGKRKKIDIERRLYKREHSQFHSGITQPPVMAQAVEAINDPEWTQKILPKLVKFYLYFSEKCDPDKDGLISVCLPTETGRDTSPDFNFCQSFNSFWFLLLLWKLEWQYGKLNWDIKKIWQKDLFNVEDVMFNCIWIDGLRSLYRLSGQKYINDLADNAENAVYRLCWDEKDKIFYNLDAKNQKIKRLTVSCLFPLILDNIPENMIKAMMGHLQNPAEFWTIFPVPSVAANDPAFDPKSGHYCNWRGPVWVNMNWFLIRGLVKHGYQKAAEQIAEKTRQMVEREGFREFYNPLSGQGLREKTNGFGWSTLVVTFPNILN